MVRPPRQRWKVYFWRVSEGFACVHPLNGKQVVKPTWRALHTNIRHSTKNYADISVKLVKAPRENERLE